MYGRSGGTCEPEAGRRGGDRIRSCYAQGTRGARDRRRDRHRVRRRGVCCQTTAGTDLRLTLAPDGRCGLECHGSRFGDPAREPGRRPPDGRLRFAVGAGPRDAGRVRTEKRRDVSRRRSTCLRRRHLRPQRRPRVSGLSGSGRVRQGPRLGPAAGRRSVRYESVARRLHADLPGYRSSGRAVAGARIGYVRLAGRALAIRATRRTRGRVRELLRSALRTDRG